MFRNVAKVTMSLAVLVVASMASAEIPDLELSTAEVATAGAVLFVRPDGNGHTFNQARLANGTVVDATITLTLVNYLGDPLPGYPAEDIWLETSGDGLVFPAGGTIADAATNASGQTEWFNPLSAGGCTIGETTVVLVAGQPLNQDGLELAFISPDIDGNLIVNLADLSTFSAAYSGAYNPCADMFYDSIVNLSDLALFSQAYGI
jgi:hypothetical protein